MHVVMFADQHVETSGGAQVAMRLQRTFLERAGHTVTIVAPRRHGHGLPGAEDEGYVDLPSIAVPTDREYSALWPGRRALAAAERGIASRVAAGAPLPDLVHVEADYWGAVLGYRLARRLRIPVVHTMHNRVDVGLAATVPAPRLALRLLNAWRRRALPGSGRGSDGWAYLRGLAAGASAVTAPSHHFARRLEEHGVFSPVDVVWNGIDDDALADVAPPDTRGGLVWVGRMSPEKRLLPFLAAYADSGITLPVEVIGSGFERQAAERLVRERGIADRVTFAGRLPYRETLARIAGSAALVQTSIGFETQGMTPFEAAQLGTPAIVSDPDVARELDGACWAVASAADEPGRVAALAAALARAAADLARGAAPEPSARVLADFVQSSRTAAMIAIYERVLGR
ncbi:glycosyltransferase [Microbacterium sp. ZXX196]|uniref:glycosyltransferase n=1 Tax=Microbacterium sp. ZXX196 TaxID=2609291 RepID=UPI0012B8CBE8|nr:glycosyltransferase [Microbacterium sp. ZXX196]MTE24120.1 glycosyltransferase [Microbacterium sp. ZXX196]